jgi:hypothetical protein
MRMNGAKLNRRWPKPAAGQAQLCLETQGRDILATIVNDAVTDAMRLMPSGSAETSHGRRPLSGRAGTGRD